MSEIIFGESKVLEIISKMKADLVRSLAQCPASIEELLALKGEARTLILLEQKFGMSQKR